MTHENFHATDTDISTSLFSLTGTGCSNTSAISDKLAANITKVCACSGIEMCCNGINYTESNSTTPKTIKKHLPQ